MMILNNLFLLLFLLLLFIFNNIKEVYAGVRSISIQNNCPETLSIGVLTNGQANPDQRFDIPSHGSRSISKPDTWGGRLYGQPQCSGTSSSNAPHCSIAGAANPATLAEFFFKGNGGKDFYDISMVDGYNIPAAISPQGVTGSGYECGTPKCKELPSCPPELAIKDATGRVVGCQSSCSKTGDPQHCCKGDYDSPHTCQADKQAKNVKGACPDSYSFAYDDQTSTFTCENPSGYTVTFC